MFTVEDNPTFKHRVEVMVPVDGGFSKSSFGATFRVLPPEELDKFDLTTNEGSSEFLRAVIVELDDIVGPDKKPIPYCDELREKMLAFTYARAGMAKTYFKAIGGARSGN